jgi:3'-5' exoribonuclease-like protein
MGRWISIQLRSSLGRAKSIFLPSGFGGLMKYFIDAEFLEDGAVIVPISFGAVAEDGRELYLINRGYVEEICEEHPEDNFVYWAGNLVTRNDFVRNHVDPFVINDIDNQYYYHQWPELLLDFFSNSGEITHRSNNELWGYYGAYDHVLLAQVFGPMINLPHPIPMFTKEIMQLPGAKSIQLPPREGMEHHALADARYQKKIWETWK